MGSTCISGTPFFNSNFLMPPISIFTTVCVANDDNAMIYCEVEYWCKVQPIKSTRALGTVKLLRQNDSCDFANFCQHINSRTSALQNKIMALSFLFSLSDRGFEMFPLWTEPQYRLPFFLKIKL